MMIETENDDELSLELIKQYPQTGLINVLYVTRIKPKKNIKRAVVTIRNLVPGKNPKPIVIIRTE